MTDPSPGADRRVWLCQCLCPQRHAILAAANEAESQSEAEDLIAQLRERVDHMLAAGAINPWCGLCRSPSDRWRYEINRTAFRSIEEAMPTLRRSERDQATTREIFGDST